MYGHVRYTVRMLLSTMEPGMAPAPSRAPQLPGLLSAQLSVPLQQRPTHIRRTADIIPIPRATECTDSCQRFVIQAYDACVADPVGHTDGA